MKSTDKTHYQVMYENYKSRMEEIESYEAPEQLGVSERIEFEIELSYGGPSDGFKIYLESETRTPLYGVYYFANWGWYEEHALTAAELETVVDRYGVL